MYIYIYITSCEYMSYISIHTYIFLLCLPREPTSKNTPVKKIPPNARS